MTNHETALAQLQTTLNSQIPLTRALGLQVTGYSEQGLELTAPLQPNINHKDTAFAGSLNALTTLAGWGLIWLLLHEAELRGKIVIQDSTISYLKPVSTDFKASCKLPEPAVVARFLTLFQRKGKSRLELETVIYNEKAEIAVAFKGRYVVQAEVKH